MSNITHIQGSELQSLAQQTAELQALSRATSTKAVYKFAWACFSRFCFEQGLQPLPASGPCVAMYVTELVSRGQRYATIRKKLAAISVAHQAAGIPRDAVPTRTVEAKLAIEGAARKIGRDPVRQMEPLLTSDIRLMLSHLDGPDLVSIRNRALLLVTYGGAFRRSEILNIDGPDLKFVDDGCIITLRRSKTSQSLSREVAIPKGVHEETCPVRALKTWIEASGIESGPVFRRVIKNQVTEHRLGDESFQKAVKKLAQKIGLNKMIGCHSLRSGHASQGAANNAPSLSIMKQGGWSSFGQMKRYVRGNPFAQNSGKYLGL